MRTDRPKLAESQLTRSQKYARADFFANLGLAVSLGGLIFMGMLSVLFQTAVFLGIFVGLVLGACLVLSLGFTAVYLYKDLRDSWRTWKR